MTMTAHTGGGRPQVNSPASFRLRPEFDAFLFAPIGEDKSGMPLSILSVLARMDLDPWLAATQLAALSPESAAQKLVSILGALPTFSLQPSGILSVATRLVAMLPHPPSSITSPLRALSGSAGTTVARPHANMLFLAVYLIFMVTTQIVMTHLLPSRPDSPPAPVSSSAASLGSPTPTAK